MTSIFNIVSGLLSIVCLSLSINVNAAKGSGGGGNGGGGIVIPPPPPPPVGTIATRQARLTNNDGSVNRFGNSVALSGDTAVISAPINTSVYVTKRTGTVWSKPIKLAVPVNPINFDTKAAISGNTIVVSTTSLSGPSKVYVFVRDTTGAWGRQAELSVIGANCLGKNSLAISNNTIVAGNWCETTQAGTNAGAAYVFVRSGTAWNRQAKLLPADPIFSGLFGFSTAIDGDRIVVGTNINSHAAYVYKRVGTIWTQEAKLVSSTPFTDFGRSVAINGTTILVGAPTENGLDSKGRLLAAAGAAYAYENAGSTWIQSARFTEGGAAGNHNQFGAGLSVNGTRAVIGDDKGFAEAGNAYVFQKLAGVWNTSGFSVGPINPALGYQFGSSVSLEGNTFFVGSLGEGPGFPPNTTGAAYVFTLPAM